MQPGLSRVTLSQADGRGASLASAEVVLRAGSQSLTLAAPTLHEVVVHVPDLPMNAELTLQPIDGGNSRPMNGMARLDPDQRTRFQRIPAGDYSLIALGDYNNAMRITVPSGEVLYKPAKPNALRVDRVTAGKLAARAGLLQGDIVLSISGRPVDSVTSTQRIYMDVDGGTSVLQVLRGGARVELTHGPATTSEPRSEVGAQFSPMTR
jgi:hypothetical protein